MAVIPLRRQRVTLGRRRFSGFGDWASDAFLATAQGQAALAAAQAAAAQLPAGFTMGDPTGDLWGASYYNGQKVIEVGQAGPGGQSYYGLADGSLGPVVSDTTNTAIQNAANAAYAVYNYINGLRTSTNPAMVAVLSDPEWIALQGHTITWDALSPELQAKIKAVPNLYQQLVNPDQFVADAQAQAAAAPPPAPSGPAIYLQGGILFGDDGTVYNQSTRQPIPGVQLTQAEVQSLKTTGTLPAGDPGPFATKQPANPPPPSSTPPATTTAPTSTSSSAPPAATGGVSDGATPGTSAGGPQPSTDLTGGGGVPAQFPTDSSPAAPTASTSGMKWGVIGLLAAGVIGAAVLAHHNPRRR